MIIVGTAGTMLWGGIFWDASWNDYMAQGEVLFVGLAYLIFGSFSYYLFRENMVYAYYFYDEVLQERHEEWKEFGDPEKEEDLPEERTD